MSGGGRASQAAETRSRLVTVSRELFAGQGYAGTSTEQVLANAGVARGALYHHFKDKADLFAAVCEALHAEAAAAITAVVTTEAEQGAGALGRLVAGCDAWLDYMSTGAARRILVLEAPAVLGWERWNDLDRRYGFGLLREGVRAAQQEGSLPDIPTDELAILLNGAVNYAVLTMRAPDSAAHLEQRKRAVHTLLYALESHAGMSQRPNRAPDS